MDGLSMIRKLREALEESSVSSWLDEQLSYDYLYEGVVQLVQRTRCVTAEQTITTVADQAPYDLNPDFLWVWMADNDGRYFVKYYNSSVYSFLRHREYEDVYYQNVTTSSALPSWFSIRDDQSMPSQITGTATSTGAATGNKSTLVDSAADFTNVSHGDTIHNTTDGSNGIVLHKNSTTSIDVALFSGANNDWTIGDAYIIQPAMRYELVLDPPPSTAAHSVMVPYIARPEPVYHDYGVYRIPSHYIAHVIDYAAAKYKFRDRDPQFATQFMAMWEGKVMKEANLTARTLRRTRFRVSMKAKR